MAVLVILPHTSVLRLSLLPFLLWRAWTCAFRLDISAGLELSLGVNPGYVVRSLLSVYFQLVRVR